MNNKIIVPLGVVLAGVLIAGSIIYSNYANPSCESNSLENEISVQEAGEKVLDFVNNNILRGQTTASLKDAIEENGIYKVKFEVEGQEVEWGMSKDGKFVFPQSLEVTQIQEPVVQEGITIGNFSVSSDEICLEDGKPIVYFFGSESCPHCGWEHPVVQEVMADFEGLVSFHDNMNMQEDMDVFDKYSSGGVPTLVIGCKYYRVGSGENEGKETEKNNITALTCKITGEKPEAVCSQVKNLIDQI